MSKAYLVLSDGSVFEGERFGAKNNVSAEIVFNCDVVGYMKTVSNPEYEGKIVVQTFPLLGNYGAIAAELQGGRRAAGYVVRECCDQPSNFRSEGTMDAFFADNSIAGICGVDTRALTRRLRNHRLQAVICDELPENLNALTGGDPNAAE